MLGLKYRRIRRIEENRKKDDYFKEMQRLSEKSKQYVLPISTRDYVEWVGKQLSDYEFRLIFVRGFQYNEKHRSKEGGLELMTQKGEAIGAEVVVDVRIFDLYESLSGTALIPKKK